MAKHTGIEPVISGVTGRRLNHSTNAPLGPGKTVGIIGGDDGFRTRGLLIDSQALSP